MRPLTRAEKQWLFPPDALLNTPSQETGLTYEEELQRRAATIDYMRSLALRVHLCGESEIETGGRAKGVLTTGSTLVHRFYMRRSLRDFKPELMAPTILFMASKIEEEPLKLRYLVNQCLDKFEKAPSNLLWQPQGDHGPAPSLEYKRWEGEILSAEEIAQETLCFDMTAENPWVILQRCIRGTESFWSEVAKDLDKQSGDEIEAESRLGQPENAASGEAEEGEISGDTLQVSRGNRAADGRNGSQRAPKHAVRLSESIISETAHPLFRELNYYPLAVLYHPFIIAFTVLYLVLAILGQLTCADALRIAAELGNRFGLDIDVDDKFEPSGDDLEAVRGCFSQILNYGQMHARKAEPDPSLQLQSWILDEYGTKISPLRRYLRDDATKVNGVKRSGSPSPDEAVKKVREESPVVEVVATVDPGLQASADA